MAVNTGSSTPSAYKMGSSTVAAVYCGSTKVWPVVTVAGAPTGVTGTSGNAQVSLSWTAPSSNGGASITDYTIQYSSNSGSTWTTFSHTASTSTAATVTGLTNGTAYVFHVAAVNSAGTSSYSTNSSSVTPAASGGATFSSANATWTALFSSGSGTSASPYTRTGAYSTNFAGAQATVVSGGTVRITGSMYSDFGVEVFKNGSTTGGYVIADSNGGNGASYTLNGTITVSAGNTIRIGTSGTDGYVVNAGQTINIWWQ